MVKATWNGVLIAESDDTVVVEGNHYFPLSAVKNDLIEPSSTTSVCPWKGTASYYSIKTSEGTNKDAAWFYPSPKTAAAEIAGRVAFWKGVKVA